MVDKTEKDKMKQLVREQISGDDGKLKWMYSSKTDTEEYLLGKRVDKTFERENELQKEVAAKSVGALFEDDVVAHNVKVDMQVKMREDPLFAIRKREEEARRALLMNPVKMMQLQKMTSAKDRAATSESDAKDRKAKKRGHHSSSSRSADELLSTYLSLLGKSAGRTADDDADTGIGHKPVHRSSAAGASSSPPVESHSDRHPSVHTRGDSTSTRSKETQQKAVDVKARPSGSEKERKKKKDKKSKKARRRHSSSSSSSSSDSDSGDNLLQKYLSLTRGAPSATAASSTASSAGDASARGLAAPAIESDAGKGSDRRQREDNREPGAAARGSSHRHDSGRRSRSPRAKGTGAAARGSHHDQERRAAARLTEEEKEARRQEMMRNAKWQEEERKKNLKKHEEEGKKEEELMMKGPKSAASFINPLMASHAQQSSVEDRLKRNRHHIQRTNAALDKNFAQR